MAGKELENFSVDGAKEHSCHGHCVPSTQIQGLTLIHPHFPPGPQNYGPEKIQNPLSTIYEILHLLFITWPSSSSNGSRRFGICNGEAAMMEECSGF